MEDDAVGSQPVGNCDGHVRVGGRRADPHRGSRTRGQLQLELVPAHAGLEELAKAELVVVVEDGVGRRTLDPCPLEAAGQDVEPTVHDPEQEWVSDRDRKLVAHGG